MQAAVRDGAFHEERCVAHRYGNVAIVKIGHQG
jgi:hypothetical protein